MKRILFLLISFVWVTFTATAQLVYSFNSPSMTLTISGEGSLIESSKVNVALGRSSSEEQYSRLARLNIITSGPTTIETNAFANCVNLATVDLPEGLTTIGGFAFSGTSLSSITFPTTLSSIGEYLFDRSPIGFVVCLSPTEPTLSGKLNVSTVYAPNASSGFNSPYWGSITEVWYGEYPPEFTYDFNAAEGLLTIGGRGGIVSVADIAKIEAIKYLPHDLKHVNIVADGFHTVGKRTFESCSSLESVVLPVGIKTLQKEAFSTCILLNSITCLSSTEPAIEGKKGVDFAFQNAAIVCTVYVPNASSGFSVNNWQNNNSVITIKYGSYPTGVTNAKTDKTFEAYVADNVLHVIGLETGDSYSVIQADGRVIFDGIAMSKNTTVKVPQRGLYLIHTNGKAKKVVY